MHAGIGKKKLNSSLSHIFLAWGHFFPILANDFVYRGSGTVTASIILQTFQAFLSLGTKG